MRRGSAEHIALRQGGGSPRAERRASGGVGVGDRIERQSNFKVGVDCSIAHHNVFIVLQLQ